MSVMLGWLETYYDVIFEYEVLLFMIAATIGYYEANRHES